MEPPSFPASSPQTVRAAPGSDAELLLPLPNGTPPFHFEWSRAGASLDGRFAASEGAGGVRLTVSSARTGDSGVYTLQASNAAGSDTRRMQLEVSAEEAPIGDDPPTFLRRLQDLTVKVGTRTRFLVEIISSTECKVTWYRNERRLMEAERVALVRDGNLWCADVATVSVEDAGRWTCTAENTAGRASCSAHLNVLVPKAYKRPEFVEELRALLTEQGTVSLECKVVGVPTPVLRWFKDSREIKAGDVFALTANAEDPTSLGTYTCEAVNCMGRAYSSSKVHVISRGAKDGPMRPSSGGVTPEPPPIFTKELEDQFVKICDHLTLSCHIVVPPWPRSVVWYNKEGKIEPSERYHVIEDGVGGYLVEVGSAEWADEGEWKCVATSTGGRVGITTCHVTMDVPKNFRKPRFMENLQAVLTEEGLVSFECKVVGFPTPVLSWFKDGQELKPGDVYQLTGTNSLGSYCCIARNCMGQASSSAELTVEDIQNQLNEEEKLQLFSKNQAPKFIQGLKSVEAKIDEPFRFTIKVAIPPEPSVLWYRDDQPIDESPRCHLGKEERGTFFLDIQNLEFLDQAEWKCVAMNDFGHSVTSCFLKLLIPRHYKKPRFLENLQAILSDEGAVNLECKVIGVPQPVLKWYKDGEELKPGDIHRIISGQDGTCCLGTYTCEAQNCMGIAASSASLLGFDDSVKTKDKKKAEEQSLQRNLSLSTIHEERTSQMYDTPMGDITLDDKGEISFSFDGKEVSVSLYETPDLTEEEALQIVEMYADQLSENITEHNVVELPPLRFVKETSTSGNLLMEAIIIDVSPEYFSSPEEDLRTEADIEDISIADENVRSLDQDISAEEKTNPILLEEKSNVSVNLKRKKSDSQKSGDDYFSLSRDHSMSDGKRDDDTQLISESDLQSFASAHSSGKPVKSLKTSEIGPELGEVKKPIDVHKSKSERKSSHGSRKSSSDSEKLKDDLEKQIGATDDTKTEMKFKEDVTNIGSSLNNIINDIQNVEKDIILKSELMSSAATASKSLEIINSLLNPLSEIHSINDAIIESIIETNDVSDTLFIKMSQSLKLLQQSLTIIEKCIDVGNDNRTLVKKTCVSLIEKCGVKLQALMKNVKSATCNSYFKINDEVVFDIESMTNEVNTIITFTSDTIKTKNLLIEASEMQSDELTSEAKYLRDTQKCIFNLKRPLISLLSIVDNADKGKTTDVANVNNSEVILADMSASIQDLQSALEQIELLSISETSATLNKYNTEIIQVVMNPVLELRNSFESLSTDSKTEENTHALKSNIIPIKNNLNVIFSYLNNIEKNVGNFDILQSDNKLEALQIIAQILISLENNLPRLDVLPNVKKQMSLFHKQLTKALENVIESNETKKYFDLIEICDAVKRINNSIHDVDFQRDLSLASINNTLQIINDCMEKNVFDIELNRSIITNISELRVSIQESLNRAEDSSLHFVSEHIHKMPEFVHEDNKVNVVVECIDRTLAIIASVTTMQTPQEQGKLALPAMENIIPILEDLRRKIACSGFSGIENEEHISEITEISSLTAETLAKPLYELNQYVSVLNDILVENPESIKECNQQISTFAEPLNELHKTLEILQHDVISQLGEELTPHVFNLNIANAVQNLQSAILIVNDNIGLEATDELSTLDDISGLKTTADTVCSEKLDMQTIVQRDVQTFLELMVEEHQVSIIEETLYKLNEQVITLQNPEYKKELVKLLNISSTTTSSSIEEQFANICTEFENVLHSNKVNSGKYSNKLVALVEPMLVLQQSLSVVDINNIPVFEHSLDISSDSIHSVFQSISELKNHLEKCAQVIVTASVISDNTIEISQSVESLRQSCEFLSKSIRTCNTMFKAKSSPLNVLIELFLDATDTTKGLNIKEIKKLSRNLLEEVLTIHDDVMSLTPQPLKEMQQEANLLEVLREFESAIIVLDQNHFDNISEPINFKSYFPQTATIIKTDQLNNFEDVLKSTINIIKENKESSDENCQKEVERFLYICENKLIILNYLINKPLTFKSITRLYQEYISFFTLVTDFNFYMSRHNMSNEIKDCLKEYLEKANNFIEIIRLSLIKIFETRNEMVVITPLDTLTNNSETLSNNIKKCSSPEIIDITNTFLNVTKLIIPNISNLDKEVISTLTSNASLDKTDTENEYIDKWDIFGNVIENILLNNTLDFKNKEKIEEMLHCLQFFSSIKDATGLAKKIMLLKCMSECSQILKGLIMNNQESQDVSNEKSILVNSLKAILGPLKDLHTQLNEIKEKEIIENVSIKTESLESFMQTAFERHDDVLHHTELFKCEINSEDKVIILDICNETQSIKNNLMSLNDEQILLNQKHCLSFMEDLEHTMFKILSPETLHEGNIAHLKKSKKILNDLQKYIGQVEFVGKILSIIEIDEAADSIKLAEELHIILTSDNTNETQREVQFIKEVSNNIERIRKLQNAIQIFHNKLLENYDEIKIILGKDDLQIATKIIEDLRVDLLAVKKMQPLITASDLSYEDRICDKNIKTDSPMLVPEKNYDDLRQICQVTPAEGNIDNSDFKEIPENLGDNLSSNQSPYEIDVDSKFTNEIIKEEDAFIAPGDPINIFDKEVAFAIKDILVGQVNSQPTEIKKKEIDEDAFITPGDPINIFGKEVAFAIEDTLVGQLNSQSTEIKKKEIVYGKLIKHIEELMSHDCAEVITKIGLLSTEPNADRIIKLAEEVKRMITTVIIQPENESFDTLKFDNFIENNANLLLELQNGISIIQTVIHEESQELPADLKTIDLQRAKQILKNMLVDLNWLNSIGSVIEHSIIEEQSSQLHTSVPISLQVCNESESDKINVENITSIITCTEMPGKEDEALDLLDNATTSQGDYEENNTGNIERVDISSTKIETEKQVVQLENKYVNENVAPSADENIETEKVISVDNLENIRDSLQLSYGNVQEEDSMQRLKSLLQEVSDEIDILTTARTVDDKESLQNNLDEIQAVIIEIKRDYDGSVNDALNETLEDLECSVRSVQLQIHESSPPELLKEACATLQLLVTNMTATQNVQLVQTTSHQAKLDNILQSCSDDTQDTLNLLEIALNMSTEDKNEFNVLFDNVNELKVIIKSLKLSFNENIEILIERGIEIMQNLDQIEDRVFALEKDVDLNNKLKPIQRDNLVTAIHSIYGTISNMRGAMTSVQKQYMFENYGKSSELVLVALKNLSFIVKKTGKEWKSLSKSLRKVLNHFEDIKFYINFDKTARLPSDSTFTKIILLDLKTVITELILTRKAQFSPEILSHTENLIKYLEDILLNIEKQSSLEVKDKIPIFKNVSLEVSTLTKCVNEYFQFTENEEKIASELKEGTFALKDANINATDENIKGIELVTSGTINIDLLIDETSQDITQLNIDNNALKDTVEFSSVEIDSNDELSKNISLFTDDKETEVSVFNLNQSEEQAGIIIETYASNFHFEVIPESIITENIAESLFLQLEELKPLQATSSQTIEARVLYKAKVTETITKVYIEDYLKSDEANIPEGLKEEKDFAESYATQENLSETREDNDNNNDTINIEKLGKDVKVDQLSEISLETQEDSNKKMEDASVTESLICDTNVEDGRKDVSIDKSPEDSPDIEKDNSFVKYLIEDINLDESDAKIESAVPNTSNAEENVKGRDGDSTVLCLKENGNIKNNKAPVDIEQSSLIYSESCEDNNVTTDSLSIGNIENQKVLVKIGQSSQNSLETRKESIGDNGKLAEGFGEDADNEKVEKDVNIEKSFYIKSVSEDRNIKNNNQEDSKEKFFQESTNMVEQFRTDVKLESTPNTAETVEKEISALQCHHENTNLGQETSDIKIKQSFQNIVVIADENPLEIRFESIQFDKRPNEIEDCNKEPKDNLIIQTIEDNSLGQKLDVSNVKPNDMVTQNVVILPIPANEDSGPKSNIDDNITLISTKIENEENENVFDDKRDNINKIITDLEPCDITNQIQTYETDVVSGHIKNVTDENNEIPVISETGFLQDVITSNSDKTDISQDKAQTQYVDVLNTVNVNNNPRLELMSNELTLADKKKIDQIENHVPVTIFEKCGDLNNLILSNEVWQYAYETEANETRNEVGNISFPKIESPILEKDKVDDNINKAYIENAQLEKKDDLSFDVGLNKQSNDYQDQNMHPIFNKENIIREETQDFIPVLLLETTAHIGYENDAGREELKLDNTVTLQKLDSCVVNENEVIDLSASPKILKDKNCTIKERDINYEMTANTDALIIPNTLTEHLKYEDVDKDKDNYSKSNEHNLSGKKEDLVKDQKIKMEEIIKLENDTKKKPLKDEPLNKKSKKKKVEKNNIKNFENSLDLKESKEISNEGNICKNDIDNESIIQAETKQEIISDTNISLKQYDKHSESNEKLEETLLKQDDSCITDMQRKQKESEAVEQQASENIKIYFSDQQNNIFETQTKVSSEAAIDNKNEAERKNNYKKNRTKIEQKTVEAVQYTEKPENEIFVSSGQDETNYLKKEEDWNVDSTDVNVFTNETKEGVISETKESDHDTNSHKDFSYVDIKEKLSETEKTNRNPFHETISKKEAEENYINTLQNVGEFDEKNDDSSRTEDNVERKNDILVSIKNLNESKQTEHKSITKEKKVESDTNCLQIFKASEKFTENVENEMLSDINIVNDNEKYESRDYDKNMNECRNKISGEKSYVDTKKEINLEFNESEDSNNHLNESSQDFINVSEIKKIELDAFNQMSLNKIPGSEDVSNVYVDDKLEGKHLFIDQTKNDYENDFLKPPRYIERKSMSDYSFPQQDKGLSCTIYKAQTLVSNIKYKPISPSSSNNDSYNEILELNSDARMKSKVTHDGQKVLTEKRSNILRDVKRKPVFSTHLTDRTAVEGSRVKLTCSVLTSTEPRVTWYKNGAPLDDKLKYRTRFLEGLLTMEVLNAVPSDSAEYSCTVETDYGSVSTIANLKVYPSFEASPIPPTFTRSIRDSYHLAEDELVLECRIRGQPLPTITWLKDDKVLDASERHQAYYLADGVCRLSVSKPSSDDSGKYTCKAENSMWSDEISHIVSFTGRESRIGPNFTSLEKSRLNRQSLESRRPHFANVLTDYKIAKGGTIGLQVEIKGSPIRVEWLREGRSITEIYRNAQTFVDHGLYTLALTDVTEKESGIYTCRAWSNQGNVDMNAAITVVKPNEIDGKPAVIIGRPQKDMLISIGEDLNISFRVQGEPKPKVTFMKGIRDITNSQRVFKMTSDDYMKFTLKRSVVSDAGTYCILARNAYGCDRAFVTVVIRQRASSENLISDWTYPMDDPTIVIDERRFKSVPNRIPGEPSVVDGGNNWLSLAWTKPDSGSGAPVQAYKIETWLLGKDGGARWTELGITPLNSFDVFNLKQGEEYHFRITPRNRYGWGESVQTSTPIGVGIAGDRPEFVNILPGQLKVLVGETATLKCSFKGKPIPEIVWMKNGHEIDEEDKRLKTNLEKYESSLTIDGVRIEDEARYSCEATNIHGRASTYARVAVVIDRLIWEADAKLKRERSTDVGGDYPPQFTMRLRDRRVQTTYPVRLTCQVIGRPPPVITWFKDGEEVEYDSRRIKSQDELFHTLEIAPTHLEDGGTYEAMARNSSGAISCRCNLVVDKGIRAYVAPEFCCGLEPLYQLSVGEELRMSAVVEAYPSVGVTWYREGIRLRPSRRVVMTLDRDGQIELAVASVTQRDAGVYTCTASNEVGKASTSGKVEVLGDSTGDRAQMLPTLVCPDVPYSKEPAFIRKPRSSEAREGDTVIIECEVIGDPKPDVYWLRDFLRPDYYRDATHFKRVGAGPEYRFEIPHAKLDYTGAYSVVAKNQYGEAKAVISLQILAKDPSSSEVAHNVCYGRVEVIPRFEKELTDLLSHDGDAVEFECRVSGNPEPDIKWYHYNEYIRDCAYFETTYEEGAARLKIKQVTADDEGTYTCEARNSLGKAKTSACLIVYPPGEPNTLSQRLRRPPALLSSASTPRSTPARSMSRTRTPVPDMRRLCSPAREIAPKFYTYPFNKVAEEGDTVVFQCAVKGLPAPWATWDKDGVVITPSSRIAIREKDEMLRTLEIEEVNSDDVGLYRVTLENDYGRAEASARLEVISHTGTFYSGGRSYSASPRRSLPYKRSKLSLPRHD